MEWKIYKSNTVRPLFVIKMNYKNENFNFSIFFENDDLLTIQEINFLDYKKIEKLNEIETIIFKEKIVEAIKKYINSKKIYIYCDYGKSYKRKIKTIIKIIKMEEK